jgi:glycosyltransferase involved in cell wall biosynthesis
MKPKFVITTTIPLSLHFYKGQIQVLKSEYDVEVLSSAGPHLDSICDQESIKGHAVNMRREVSVFNDIKSLIGIIRALSRIKPKVVHGSTPKAGFLTMLAGWLLGINTRIYYLHGLRYDGLSGRRKKFLMAMERLTCFFATNIFAVSFGVKENLRTDKITKKEISVIGNGSVNGINADFFNRNHPDLLNGNQNIFEADKFVFGFVGRLVRDKGINELVNCFIQLNTAYPDTRLLLVGDYEDLDPINESVRSQIESNPNIHFAGFQADIRPLLKQMNVFVFPSYREGFGVSLMEALAMQVPAISSDIIGCNEIIEHRKNGLLIPPRSAEKLCEAMGELIRNQELYNKLLQNSRELVIAKYEQKALWDNTLKAYLKINKN